MLKCGHTSGAVVQLLAPITGDGIVTYVLPLLQLPGLCKCGLPWVLSNMFKSMHDIRFVFTFIFHNTITHMRRTAGYTWKDYKTNAQIATDLKITPILGKLLEYRRSWIQHVNRMPRNRLPRVMKHYCPTGRKNHGRPLKRLLDT